MSTRTPTIATPGHDGRLSIIVDARHVELDDGYDDIGHARAEARQRAAEDGVQYHDDEWDEAMDDLAGMDLEDQFDALMDAARDERFALPAWEDAREREREAMPVPDGLGVVPF